MSKSLDLTSLLSSAAMISRKAGTYPPETQVLELVKLRQIILELQEALETKLS